MQLQYALMIHLSVKRVVLMVNSRHVSSVSSFVIMLLTVLEGKMNWITTVLVDLREQYVWWTVLYLIRAEWSIVWIEDGQQCATLVIDKVILQQLCVINWDIHI